MSEDWKRHRVTAARRRGLRLTFELISGTSRELRIRKAISRLSFPRSEKVRGHQTGAVPVDEKLVEAAARNTGIIDREELVSHALTLLASADPSADFARQSRGVLRGLRLDI